MKIKSLFILLLTSLSVFAQERTTLVITGTVSNAISFSNKELIINGKTDLHISAANIPLTNSVIKLNSENSFVFFDNIRPQVVIDSILSDIYINGVQASNKTNARVSIYRHGTIVMPQGSVFQPLEVYSGQNFTGDLQKYSLNVYNNSLGVFDNKIRSFKLKRGYMATLANNPDGSGYSRVFIASDGDLEVPTMSAYLDRTVSFIRVFQYDWVSKKGWCQTGTMSKGDAITNTNKMKGTWLYTWSADYTSRPNIEYVPEKWQLYWPSWDQINSKESVTHVIGYNEPDHTEQSNVSVADAVKHWPEFMNSGLRIGSPACTDFSAWLYPFMDSIKAHNYRCDYVVIHAYWGGYTPTQWYNALKAVHDKTGRPIWIKEWNNGADWTTETWPSDYGEAMTKQYNELKAILNVMDTAHFVERYSIYNWVGYKRMLITDDGWVTPAGELYRDNKPDVAFRKVNEVIPTYKLPAQRKPVISLNPSVDNSKISLNWENTSQEFAYEVVVERKADNGIFSEIYRTNSASIPASYTELPDFTEIKKYTYRVRLLFNNGTEQISNEKAFNVISGAEIQYGNLSYSNIDWNLVGFKNAYSSIPSVFVGAPTNNNSSTLMTPKVKISSSRMMNLQLLPWSYQDISTLTNEEKLPYFIIKPGKYDFSGLSAIVSKTIATASWTKVNFSTPFDTVPVVLVSPTTDNNGIPFVVRVRNITKTGFEVKLQKESKITTALVSEIFSYFAIEQGVGWVNGNKIKVGRTAENGVGNAITQYARIMYDETIDNPVFIAQLQTCNDDTVTASLRCRSVLTTEARVFKQREQSLGFTNSAFETAGYILLNPDIYNEVDILENPDLSLYPNPVADCLYITGGILEPILFEIYNLYGIKVKSEILDKQYIDVSNLNTGCYYLKSNGFPVLKFIKK